MKLDTEKTESKDEKRSMMPWLVAAAAAVILGAAIILVTQSTEEAPPATQLTPTTIADAAPTTLADVMPTTEVTPMTLDAVEAAWQEITPWISGGNGEFRTNTFSVPFAFSTEGASWTNGLQGAEWIFLRHNGTPSVILDVFVVEMSVEEATQEWVSTHDAVEGAEMTEPVEVTIAGANRVRFDSSGLPINKAMLDVPEVIFFSAPDGGVPAGQEGFVYIIEVNDQTLIVAVSTAVSIFDVAFTPEPGDVESATSDALALINTIIWKDLN